MPDPRIQDGEGREAKRTLRQRLACWLGNHPALAKTWGPYPYPDAYHCVECGRLDHLIDNHVSVEVLTSHGERTITGIRYANFEQWLEERGGY